MFGETLGESTLMECSQYFNIDASFLIPVLVLLAYLPAFVWQHWLIAGVFLLAAITDWFDGYLARALKSNLCFWPVFRPCCR
jgi:phosphatidylglycerophosphate synthase